jgi:hypothetical protein
MLGEVVGDASVETNVAVKEQDRAKGCVEDRGEGATDEGCDCQRNDTHDQ